MPAQNFDQVHPEDRSFVLGGQTFHWLPMHWRAWGEMVEAAIEREARQEAENKEIEARGETPKDTPLPDQYEQLVEDISNFIDPSEVDSFKAVVNDPARRVSHLQLNELRGWLREVTNNRPTQTPSLSEGGPGSVEATLRAV